MEVGRRRRAADLKGQQSHLVVNSLLNGQPEQRVQQRRGVGSSWRLEDDPSSVVLHTLQLPDGVGWSTVEHSVAVIDLGQDQTARQCLCKVRRQQAIRDKEVKLLGVGFVKQVGLKSGVKERGSY